ncbi:MAG TPA: metallophosphoesterase [Sphingomicrobium sp.]|nr:metallophosphoesterase [Sphingomicrobium sp.]
MMSRRFFFAGFWASLAALVLALAVPAHTAAPTRIVAIGDLHGDFSAWTDIARDAGLIDASGHWKGGSTILVQMGDVTDRGPDSLKIITALQQLQREATVTGGKVIVILGNHEAMNTTGDLRYVSAGEYQAFANRRSAQTRQRYYDENRMKLEAEAKAADPSVSPAAVRAAFYARTPLGWVEHRQAWSPSGRLGKWAATNPAIVKIGDTLFVHGGISEETARAPLDTVNRQVAAAMAAGDARKDSILFDPLGPLWYRGLVIRDPDAEAARSAAKRPIPRPRDELAKVLSAYGAKRIVVGHTPSIRGIAITEGGWLARIDTGNSAYYGGQLSWLEIQGEKLIPHNVRRTAR